MDNVDEDDRTLWCGNLSDKVTEEILYELFLQAGPVQRVTIPKDRDGKQRTYGFVRYKYPNSVPYAMRLFDGTMLYSRRISMQPRNSVEPTSQKEPLPDKPISFDKALELGHQVLCGKSVHEISFPPHDTPRNNSKYQTKMEPKFQEVRPSRRMHPYQMDQTVRHSNSRYNDRSSSRSAYDNNKYYPDKHSRHNYKGKRHGYR